MRCCQTGGGIGYGLPRIRRNRFDFPHRHRGNQYRECGQNCSSEGVEKGKTQDRHGRRGQDGINPEDVLELRNYALDVVYDPEVSVVDDDGGDSDEEGGGRREEELGNGFRTLIDLISNFWRW